MSGNVQSGPFNDLVNDVVTDRLTRGATSLYEIRAAVVNEVQRSGVERFGFGMSWLLEMVGRECDNLAKQKLKGGLYTDNEVALMRVNRPPAFVDQLRKLPRAIAINDGAKATWVASLYATAEQWEMNANMKAGKAKATIKQADESMNWALYLRKYGMSNLAEGL